MEEASGDRAGSDEGVAWMAHGGMVGGVGGTSGSLRVREGMHAEKNAAPQSNQGKVRVIGVWPPGIRTSMSPPSIGEALRGKFPAPRSRTGRWVRHLAPTIHTNAGYQTGGTCRLAARAPLRHRSGTNSLGRAAPPSTKWSRDRVAALAFTHHGKGFARSSFTRGRESVVANPLETRLSG